MELRERNQNDSPKLQKSLPQISIADSESDDLPTVITFNPSGSCDNNSAITELEPDLNQSTSQLDAASLRYSGNFDNILGNAVEAKNITFGYNNKSSVLTDISIDVPKGLLNH